MKVNLKRIFIQPNSQYWNDNKPVLEIPFVLTISNQQKIENKKAVIWHIRVYNAIIKDVEIEKCTFEITKSSNVEILDEKRIFSVKIKTR